MAVTMPTVRECPAGSLRQHRRFTDEETAAREARAGQSCEQYNGAVHKGELDGGSQKGKMAQSFIQHAYTFQSRLPLQTISLPTGD